MVLLVVFVVYLYAQGFSRTQKGKYVQEMLCVLPQSKPMVLPQEVSSLFKLHSLLNGWVHGNFLWRHNIVRNQCRFCIKLHKTLRNNPNPQRKPFLKFNIIWFVNKDITRKKIIVYARKRAEDTYSFLRDLSRESRAFSL